MKIIIFLFSLFYFFILSSCSSHYSSNDSNSTQVINFTEIHRDHTDIQRLIAWFQQGYPEPIIQYAPLLLERYPNHHQLRLIYAQSLFKMGDYPQAISEFKKLESSPLNSLAIIGISETFKSMGETKLYLETLEKAEKSISPKGTGTKDFQRKKRSATTENNTTNNNAEIIHHSFNIPLPDTIIPPPRQSYLEKNLNNYLQFPPIIFQPIINQTIPATLTQGRSIYEIQDNNPYLSIENTELLTDSVLITEHQYSDLPLLRMPVSNNSDDYIAADLLTRYKEGQYRSVINEGNSLLEKMPENLDLRLIVANSQMKLGQIAQAKRNFGLLLDSRLELQALLALSTIYRWSDQIDLALKSLAKAQQMAPNHPDVEQALKKLEKTSMPRP